MQATFVADETQGPGARWTSRISWTWLLLLLVLAAPACSRPVGAQSLPADPLPSWNSGPTKAAVIDFIGRVTRKGGPDFVPVSERVATLDNDGTLWTEQPLPNELYFVLASIRERASRDPSLAERQPFKAALEGDRAYFTREGEHAAAKLIVTTHSELTQEQFAENVARFLEDAQHPQLNRPFLATVYQPMLELIRYLRANGFQVWLCSGGTTDFMRGFASGSYGIPPERVIGSELKREARWIGGRRTIWRLPELEPLNDKDLKPVNIDRSIGRRPVFVAGNVRSGGDIAMMEYSKGRSGPSLQLLVNHDDEAREFAYGEPDDASLAAASAQGFKVVSIREDWKTVFAEAP